MSVAIQTRAVTSLELDKVLAMLADQTTCEAARQMALHLMPVTSAAEAQRLMAYTADANRLTNRYGTPSTQNVRDCTAALDRARIGGQLPIPELLNIRHLLESIRRMMAWKRQSEEETTALDYLFRMRRPSLMRPAPLWRRSAARSVPISSGCAPSWTI